MSIYNSKCGSVCVRFWKWVNLQFKQEFKNYSIKKESWAPQRVCVERAPTILHRPVSAKLLGMKDMKSWEEF